MSHNFVIEPKHPIIIRVKINKSHTDILKIQHKYMFYLIIFYFIFFSKIKYTDFFLYMVR